MRIITEPNELIARYVARKCGITTLWGAFSAVALVNEHDELMAGAVFYGFRWPNILMNVAAERFTPAFMAAITHYPFVQLKCRSVTGLIGRKNKPSRDFAEHWGAKMRGKLEEAAEDDDIMIYQLMARDAQKWIEPRYMKKLAEVA